MAHIDGTILSDIIPPPFTGLSDIIHPGAGNDTVRAGGGNDVVDDSVSHAFWSIGPNGIPVLNPGIGAGGNDVFYGGTGNDLLVGYTGNDRLYGEADNDTLRGGTGNDLLSGGTGIDQLFGDAGNDTLYGGAGVDSLTGGSGEDLFLYASVNDSTGTGDLINGFDGAGIHFSWETEDKIDLRRIDAIAGTRLDDAFRFWGELTDAEGRDRGAGALWVHNVGDVTYLHGNIDGDDTIELTIRIADGTTTADDYWSGDFFL